MAVDSSSLERLVPDDIQSGDVTGEETLSLHLARYEFAASHARPGRLLDIACGVGYGTALMAERNPAVACALGVDLSKEAVDYAARRYGSGRVQFRSEDAAYFNDPTGFDTIVSLETIEHVPDPGRFVAHVLRHLRPGGVFIASVPTTPSVDANPHHLHDFTERSFRKMVERHDLREIACLRQIQRFNPVRLLNRTEKRSRDLRPRLWLYYLAHPIYLVRRVAAVVRFGFTNRYVTIAWKSDVPPPSEIPSSGS